MRLTSAVRSEYGKPRRFSTKTKGAQEAHEATRPIQMDNKVSVEIVINKTVCGVLIWRGTSIKMAEALLWRAVVKISNDKNRRSLNTNGEVITFEGFLKIYLKGTDHDDDELRRATKTSY